MDDSHESRRMSVNESNSLSSLLGYSTTQQDLEDGEGVQVAKTETLAKKRGGKRKRTSDVWNHFTIATEKDSVTGLLYGTCNYCKVAKYDSNSYSGTSIFSRHLKACDEYKKLNPESAKSDKEFDQKVFRRLLVVAIMRYGYSFSTVEHEAFREVFKYLNDNVEPISRNTIKKECLEIHMEFKEKIMNVLKGLPGRICLTCDLWTACNSRSYLCVTSHYIDHNWKLSCKVLCFQHCPPTHGGYELSVEMAKVLSDWGIKGKIFSITADNASNMGKMISNLKEGELANLPCKGKYVRICCSAHVLNLIVQDGLKLIKPLISKVREGIKYIDGTEARLQKFIDLFKNSGISYTFKLWIDVPTRWNSTYTMLERALKYRIILHRYFGEMDGDASAYCLEYEEWDKIEKICELLEPFNEITNLFSGSDYPTANLFFPEVSAIKFRLQMLTVSDDVDITAATLVMMDKFNKYWDEFVLVLSFAMVFDPRYKLKFVKFALTKTHGVVEGKGLEKKVRSGLDEIFKEYQKSISGPRNSVGVDSCESFRSKKRVHFEEFVDYDRCDSEKSELDIYLDEKREDISKDLDVLSYWKDNSARFPILCAISRDILAIPITSVASESTFSMGGRILSKWRSSLLSKKCGCTSDYQRLVNRI